MHVSLSELEVTVAKAVRGAGLPPALGDDAARTARHMALHAVDPAAALLPALQAADSSRSGRYLPQEALDEGRWRAGGGCMLSALWTAGVLADNLNVAVRTGDGTAIAHLLAVDAPVVILFSLLDTMRSRGTDLTFRADVGSTAPISVLVRDGALWAGGDEVIRLTAETGVNVEIRLAALSPHTGTLAPLAASTGVLAEGVELDGKAWHRIERLAERCLVEASEGSRLRGAGAGLADND